MAAQAEVKRNQLGIEEAFSSARVAFDGLLGTLSTTETLGLEHSKVEALTRERGFEVLRLMFQGHLDLRGDGEVASGEVEGADGNVRTHTRFGSRALMSLFGAVVVARVAPERSGGSQAQRPS